MIWDNTKFTRQISVNFKCDYTTSMLILKKNNNRNYHPVKSYNDETNKKYIGIENNLLFF